MNKHKHYDTIMEWAKGKDVEIYDLYRDTWHAIDNPNWHEDVQYRIKQETPKDIVREALIVNSLSAGPLLYAAAPSEANVELVFDGTTGKLKGLSFKQPQKPF